jgi:DNA-directed RNA polymerase specialized sigma24 family protein
MKFDETPIDKHIDLVHSESKLKDLIDMLPDDQKEVVMLRHYFDFSFKEIAEYSKVSINTSLGRMRYALINLRKANRNAPVRDSENGRLNTSFICNSSLP